ncbi:MAG TPA: hypothetical protein DEF34_03395 [Desulfotomaculum sp.]|nr:MAG: hypothetical protein JL56_03005 [Desulfotomaculum sp. BICA1-6]HBX22673.1 hypothetical protein [Desulfotomaculum sp.]
MAGLTTEMIQKRYETVASGTYAPEIPGLPGLVFVKMGLAERGHSSRAYSAKLKELYAAGGYFSEALLPAVLEKTCRENGLDVKVMQKHREIMKRLFESIPAELAKPYDQLTPEEVAQLAPEEQAARAKEIEQHGRRMMEWANAFYTDDDRQVMEQAKQIESLEQHLKANTAEHHARKHQMEMEILLCVRKADDIEKPYFGSVEDVQELEDRNRQGLVRLYMTWKQFKEGLLPDFFRADSIN